MTTITFTPSLMLQLTTEQLTDIQQALAGKHNNITLSAFFDARNLACPMPLLKAKIALRGVATDESLYLIASDKNSQTDLVAFCQKQGLSITTWQSDDGHNTANYFHFIITKKASV
ncbi:sulfurtransferase TusA family protein [Moraxella haemolytica]|uniref:sulfurtransferase TusA family protein n=1 Tax=Moraxella TaxID=475 RepID=UPI00254353FA|nr:sulfurtransferase TusA family protein [Moraxella sp. ZY171148]WII95729.1 sulfurtransferase TusA family protein [Moraxella sp. ZY171148]